MLGADTNRLTAEPTVVEIDLDGSVCPTVAQGSWTSSFGAGQIGLCAGDIARRSLSCARTVVRDRDARRLSATNLPQPDGRRRVKTGQAPSACKPAPVRRFQRSRDYVRTAGLDPRRSLGAAPAGYPVRQEGAIRICQFEPLIRPVVRRTAADAVNADGGERSLAAVNIDRSPSEAQSEARLMVGCLPFARVVLWREPLSGERVERRLAGRVHRRWTTRRHGLSV